MKNMMNKFKVVLALAMVAICGMVEAGGWYYAQCKVQTDPDGKGLVAVYQDSTSNPNYQTSSDETKVKCPGYVAHSSADIKFYCYAKNYDWVGDFLCWKNASGTQLSTSTTYTHTINSSKKSKSDPQKETIYGYFHVHTFEYVAEGMTITYHCSNTEGNCVSKPSKTATLTAEDKVYDGTAYAATVTGDTTAALKYYSGEEEIDAPVNVGTYTVKMTYGDKTVSKDFSITAAPIDAISLVQTEFFYTGSEQTVELNTVTASEGTFTLTEGTDYTVTGNKATGNPTQDTQCTVTVTGKGNYQGTQTANWVIKGHTHNFTCTPSEGKLSIVCNGTTTCTIPGGTSLEIVCEGKTYDGTPLTATIKDNTPEQSSSAYTFETYTGGSYTEISWDDASANAGAHTASFKATVNGKEYEISKTFTIEKKSIEGATMTLSATSLPYSGADQTVTITSVKIGDFNVTYTEDADSVRTEKAIGTHTVKITANGNFTGAASANWTITNYSGSLKSVAATQSGVGTISGNTLTVTDSSKLEYDSANQVWYAGLTLTWDHSTTKYSGSYGYAVFTKPAAAQLTIGDVTYTGSDAVTGVSADGWNLSGAQKTEEYEYASFLYGGSKNYTYLDTTTLKLKLTPAIIEAAKSAGVITLSMYAGSLPFKEGDNNTQWSNGVKFDTYTITVQIDENLKLYDQYDNQVYPDAGYVAQVGNYKYTTLAEAMTYATAELPVTLIGNAEAGTFEIGQNITVNLGGYGNAEASYKFVNVTDEAMSAKVVSTKAENVTTEVTGFAVNNDNFTYTLYRAHQHLWEAATSGATLTASCTNMLTDCDIDGRQTAITLTVTGGSDGVAPTFAIDNKDDFLTKVNKFSEVAVIGEITVVRKTDDGAATTKWYVGNYTASCIVTVNGEEKTITQEFSIAKSGEYTTGYAVASRDIRYDSLSEAVTAAKVGDTVYYRNGNLDQQNIYFNVDKDVILDCREATFTYTGTGGDMAICNNGAGTLTLQNVTIVEPVYEDFWGTDQYHNISLSGGNFVLGTKVYVVKGSDEFQINAMANVGVSVTNGIYQCAFEEHETGASVEISGGVFWPYNDHCKPQDSMIKEGYVVVTKSNETVGNYYEVVPHSHDLYYETNGNVITIRCEGAGYEGCDKTLNTYKLTLTAADAFEGSTYTGASYTHDAGFEFEGDDPAIEYYKDGVKVGTPSEYGNYEAWVTVTINCHTATAVKAFTIKHVHQFKYDIAPAETLTATCTNDVSDCDIEGRATAITLTVTDNGDGVEPTFAIANKDAFLAFVNRDATVASVGEITTVRTTDDGAETTKWYVGDYTSTCIVTISGVQYTLTKNFSIVKTAEYTSGWTVGSRDIRYDSWDEALVAAADGDTIYYRGEDRKYETHDFSIGAKNLTIDFSGRTLTKASYVTMTIKNSGSGTLTLQNVVIKQPRGSWSGQIETEGNIVFGDGVKVENTAEDSANYCTITVNSGTLIVSNGLYQCGFATDGGTVNLRAGKYWKNDKPVLGQYNLADRACIEIEGDYKYEIVPHVHSFASTAEGNVITSVCNGEYKEGCYWYQNPQTATLTANDAAESSEPYAGASVAYSEFWSESKELAITYWNGDTQLDSAPTRFGTYTAKITLNGTTAEKSFTITPMAVTITVKNAEHASLVVYEGDTVVASDTEEYAVTHGNKITAVYTADEGYAPAVITNVIECAENGDTITAPIFKEAAVEFTLAAPANASVTKVMTNGVEIATPYKVEPGTVVTVTYTANAGYLFANGTDTMDAEVTVEEAGEQPAPTGTETTEGAARIGTVYYLTLKDAITNAADQATVTVVKDCTVNERINMAADKSLTLDANGKTVTISAETYAFVMGGTESENGDGVFTVTGDGTFQIKDGEADANGIILWARHGDIVVTNGTFTMSGSGEVAFARNGCTIDIYGGTMKNLTANGDVLNVANDESVTQIQCYGGSYSKNPAFGDDYIGPTFVADGYRSVKNEVTGLWDIEKGPAIIEPIGGDPEETPEIKPVEGTNGVYVVEVKTNTTTAVEITGLGEDDTVIVPPQINAVNGANAGQVVVVADATNTTGTVKVDITSAFTITDTGSGALIDLNPNAEVTVKIEGKADEKIAVVPELGTAEGTTVAETPFVVTEEKVSTGVKTIPGLTYNLLSGDEPGAISDVVKTIVAEDTRVVLEVMKGADSTKFYKIEVMK